MTSGPRLSAVADPDRLGELARVMLAFRDHGGCATEDQIISHLGDVPTVVVRGCLSNLIDSGYAEQNGERKGWARRTLPLFRLTDKGRRVAAAITRPDPAARRTRKKRR